MGYVVEGILNKDQISELKIVQTVNIHNHINIDNGNYPLEILSANINVKEVIKDKIQNKYNNLYIIKFTYSIDVDIYINKKVDKLEIKDISTSTFTYKDIDLSDLSILPINIDLKSYGLGILSKVSIASNFLIVDKSKDVNLTICSLETNEIAKNINNKDYSYININQEFN
ncbi:MAG: hypothetical protein ACRC3Y_13850 [Romboutsia sp.]|uniref:hypothetical protein n=1 Tax=Romboutsia sp. TaxID=1965302 RepID=UPI003F2FEA17